MSKHPYLIVDVSEEYDVIEIAQIDSLDGKGFKAAMRSNITIFCDEPHEAVIDKDSFVQLDNTLRIEYFDELSQYRRQTEKLSDTKLKDVLNAYASYHKDNQIDEIKIVYMDKTEILELNS